MWFTEYQNRKGQCAKVFEDGYVDFSNYDKKYDSEKAAIADLERKGFKMIGVDKIDF